MDEKRLEKISACTLARLLGYEPLVARGIIDALGSARAIFDLNGEELRNLTGPYGRLAGRINRAELEISEGIVDRLEREGKDFIPITDPAYPALLKECPDAPAGLYVRACTPLQDIFGAAPAVAVVGTRDLSPYGKEWCERIVIALSKAKVRPVVVSGLAIGVDVAAHMTALACGLPTVGVLPTGIDEVYPRRHAVLAGKMASSPGSALVTDYPPGTAPVQLNFIRRNRIIAGLCSAVILVESKVRGGGMMTARLASGYGRTVLALPGRVDDLRSGGCNLLLQERLAEPLTDLSHLPEVLGLGKWQRGRCRDLAEEVRTAFGSAVDENRLDLLVRAALLIRGHRGVDVGAIGAELQVPCSEAAVLAGMLETEGFISVDLFQRCAVNVSRTLIL